MQLGSDIWSGHDISSLSQTKEPSFKLPADDLERTTILTSVKPGGELGGETKHAENLSK